VVCCCRVVLPYRVVFASTLSAVHAFLGESVSHTLQCAAFAELAADEVVDAVLGFVDGLDAGDFGFVESIYQVQSSQSSILGSFHNSHM
jgi:hypothetical protein